MASICVNHTDRAAAHRCMSCHKPVCQECVVKSDAATYCSKSCADGAARFYARYEGPSPPGLFSRLKNLFVSLVALGVLAAIGVGVGAYIFKVQVCINLLKQVGL